MSKVSFAEVMNDVRVMVEGLKSNEERVSKRGISVEFITAIETDLAQAGTLDTEQEKFKAALKSKTVELDAKVNDLKMKYNEAKKVVKLEMEQSLWKEFGIQDKR